ncbi:MAG: hypothetical protein AB1921_00615 [Thermodesulfobacteriota bacterium]
MKGRGFLAASAALSLLLCLGSPFGSLARAERAGPEQAPAVSEASFPGVWACQSMAGESFTGRPCRFTPWLTVQQDKSYIWGQESGTWTTESGRLSLSGWKGRGRINEDGKLVFEYETNGKTYIQTLYRRQ